MPIQAIWGFILTVSVIVFTFKPQSIENDEGRDEVRQLMLVLNRQQEAARVTKFKVTSSRLAKLNENAQKVFVPEHDEEFDEIKEE